MLHFKYNSKCSRFAYTVAAPEICCGGIEGQNAFLRGQKSKILPKMADFCHFFPFLMGKGGGQVGGRASDGGQMPPHAPLDAATVCIIWNLWKMNPQN